MSLPFRLPPPQGAVGAPQWVGCGFELDGASLPVLEYSENFSGWSDDLTALHEDAAGDRHPIDIASREEALEQVSLHLPESGVVMEIGCSSGFLIQCLARRFPLATVIGADVVREPLFRLAKQVPGIPLIRFDLLQSPLPAESIDVLVMLNVLEHVEDDRLALQKAFQLLKPGGALVMEVPAGPSLYDAYDRELHHFRRYSRSELLGKLRDAGFQIARSSHLGFLVYPAFAAVKLLNRMRHQGENAAAVVHRQARKTNDSWLLSLAMTTERRLFSGVSLPCGIRVLAVASKPQ